MKHEGLFHFLIYLHLCAFIWCIVKGYLRNYNRAKFVQSRHLHWYKSGYETINGLDAELERKRAPSPPATV
jgi:hypothetical protein